jgi:transposase
MRFYTKTHNHYCGIDLHAKTMYLCILDSEGTVVLHRNMLCEPEKFLRAIAPYRDDLVVAVECMFTWYWLADLCAREGIAFVLGHALYMKAIHGAKAKNDRIDSKKIAALLKGGLIPKSYVYPAEMRATRDLFRRRIHFVRHRGQLLAHIQNTHHQYGCASPGKRIAYRSNREGIAEAFDDIAIQTSLATDLELVDYYDAIIGNLELTVLRQARGHDRDAYERLKTIPGIGKILALTILYEIHDIDRFPRVQDFASYCRLVKCQSGSAGKIKGTSGAKMGNAHLKWAFSEAAVLLLAKCPEGKKLVDRLAKKHGKGKALSILAHRIGRATYFMLKRKRAFDLERFLRR